MEPKENQKIEENQQEPLSSWVILERLNNAVGVIGGLYTLYASLVSPSALTKPPEVQIPPAVLLMMNQLSGFEDNETLSKAINALSELQQLISERASELKKLAKGAELEKNIAELDAEAVKLEALKNRIEDSREAILWLDPVTKKEFLKALARQTGNAVLGENHPQIKQFYFDIEEFLRLIRRSLIVCRPNLLDRVVAEKKLPSANVPNTAYKEAFKFIIDEIPDTLPFLARTELIAYLNYLTNILS